MSIGNPSGRVVSMDQFRGYTVAGMFLVNFVGSYAAIHAVLKHNDTYFSYADSIMPSFMFAVGFSYRLTFRRRLRQIGWLRTCLSYMRRSLALVVVSLAMFGLGGGFRDYGGFDRMPDEFEPQRAMAHAPDRAFFNGLESELAAIKDPKPPKEPAESEGQTDEEKEARKKEFEEKKTAFEEEKKQIAEQRAAVQKKYADQAAAARASFVDAELQRRKNFEALGHGQRIWLKWKIFLLELAKSNTWETLAIIGVTQIVLMPIIAGPSWLCVVGLFALGAWDVWMADWFNWEFVYGYRENWMVRLWGTGTNRSWDGGFFGPLTWAIAMLGGAISFDTISKGASVGAAPTRLAARLFAWGALLMAIGYGMSCLTRLYEMDGEDLQAHKALRKQHEADRKWLGGLIEGINQELKPVREQIGKLNGEINKVKKGEYDALFKKYTELPENAGLKPTKIANLVEKELKAREERKEVLPRVAELEAEIEKVKAEAQLARKEAEISVIADQIQSYPNLDLAASPVAPPWDKLKSRGWRGMIVEPPFVAPPKDDPRVDPAPHVERRQRNYWMMSKRMPNMSFMAFATGFAFALYALFVVMCDAGPVRIGLFRTFGMNPLAAYLIHEVTMHSFQPLIPENAPLAYVLIGFGVFFAVTYIFVRYLEKNEIYLRM